MNPSAPVTSIVSDISVLQFDRCGVKKVCAGRIIIAIILIIWAGCTFITHQAEIVHGEIVKNNIKEVYKNGEIKKSTSYDLYYTIDGDSDSISSIIVKCYDKNGNLTEEKKVDMTSRGEWRVFLSQPVNSATVTIEFNFGLLSEPFNISKVKEEPKVIYNKNPVSSTTKSNQHSYYDILAKSQNPGAIYSGE